MPSVRLKIMSVNKNNVIKKHVQQVAQRYPTKNIINVLDAADARSKRRMRDGLAIFSSRLQNEDYLGTPIRCHSIKDRPVMQNGNTYTQQLSDTFTAQFKRGLDVARNRIS
jgi:hypothetical protein